MPIWVGSEDGEADEHSSYMNGFKLRVVKLAIKNGNRSAGKEY